MSRGFEAAAAYAIVIQFFPRGANTIVSARAREKEEGRVYKSVYRYILEEEGERGREREIMGRFSGQKA